MAGLARIVHSLLHRWNVGRGIRRVNLLGFEDGVDEDDAVELAIDERFEDSSVKLRNRRARDEEVKPRMRNLPQSLGTHLNLQVMNSV